MELGAVVGAAPKETVQKPEAGDVWLFYLWKTMMVCQESDDLLKVQTAAP